MIWGTLRQSQGLAGALIRMLTAVIGQAVRFDLYPLSPGVGGFHGLFNGTERVFDLFGGQVIGKIQGRRDQRVRGSKMKGAHFIDIVDFGRCGGQRADTRADLGRGHLAKKTFALNC